jgi:uncharacterized protein YcsI (UPF0317 family)
MQISTTSKEDVAVYDALISRIRIQPMAEILTYFKSVRHLTHSYHSHRYAAFVIGCSFTHAEENNGHVKHINLFPM